MGAVKPLELNDQDLGEKIVSSAVLDTADSN
jgi:hypothetical protein